MKKKEKSLKQFTPAPVDTLRTGAEMNSCVLVWSQRNKVTWWSGLEWRQRLMKPAVERWMCSKKLSILLWFTDMKKKTQRQTLMHLSLTHIHTRANPQHALAAVSCEPVHRNFWTFIPSLSPNSKNPINNYSDLKKKSVLTFLMDPSNASVMH